MIRKDPRRSLSVRGAIPVRRSSARVSAIVAALGTLVGWSAALPAAAWARQAPSSGGAGAGLDAEERATIALFQRACPSVVFVTSLVLHRDEISLDVMEMPEGTGSGFVWDAQGHVVTNFHVVMGGDAIAVTLDDRSTWPARLVGAAPEKDLAVLKIDAPAALLWPLPLGSSHDLRVGQKVFAIGNPFGLDHSLTTGVVSALGREIDSVSGAPIRDVIQTDAAINPGNSGGPLLDSSGRLVGVNSALLSPSGTSAGVGFAIPAQTIQLVVPQLIAHGRIQRPSLGIELAPDVLTRAAGVSGALVLVVEPGGPAERAGLVGVRRQAGGGWVLGDVIKSFEGVPIATGSDLLLLLEERHGGESVRLALDRAGVGRTVTVTLAPPPEHRGGAPSPREGERR